jgi:hypothetical protein
MLKSLWLQILTLRRGDIAGIIFVLGLAGLLAVRIGYARHVHEATGFDHDWNCNWVPTQSGPDEFCVKNIQPPKPKSSNGL